VGFARYGLLFASLGARCWWLGRKFQHVSSPQRVVNLSYGRVGQEPSCVSGSCVLSGGDHSILSTSAYQCVLAVSILPGHLIHFECACWFSTLIALVPKLCCDHCGCMIVLEPAVAAWLRQQRTAHLLTVQALLGEVLSVRDKGFAAAAHSLWCQLVHGVVGIVCPRVHVACSCRHVAPACSASQPVSAWAHLFVVCGVVAVQVPGSSAID
jgi:hypothetical protein